MAILGFGCDVQVSTDGGSTYSSLGKLTEFDLGEIDMGEVRTSYLQMPDPVHQFMASIGDAKEIKCTLIFAKADYAAVLTKLVSRTNYYFRLVFSDLGVTASTYVNQGFFKSLGATGKLEDMVTCPISIRQSGKPTFTQGT